MDGYLMQSDPAFCIDDPTTQGRPADDNAHRDNFHGRPSCICLTCHALEADSRQRWCAGSVAPGLPRGTSEAVLCPACQCCRERQPAGTVLLEMRPSSQYEACLRDIIHAQSRRLIQDDPMKRVIDIQRQEHGLLVTTTTIDLARAIGEAVQRSMRGHLEMHYQKPEGSLRVRWLPWE